ncbi:MAG TPA: tol-pal system protein YbgF [Paracoccaceae bacterium]|nr:tol-pal system protein YbgF [Paracoccaceae bacterium]
MLKNGKFRRRGGAALIGAALAGLMIAAPVAPLPASAQSSWGNAASPANLQNRIDALDAEIADLRARLGQGASDGSASLAGTSSSRFAVLEGEIRRLTASVEELQHRVRLIGEEAARYFSDIEFRLTELEGGDITTLKPVPPLGSPPEDRGSDAGSGAEPPASGIVPGPEGQGSFEGIEVPASGEGDRRSESASPEEQGDLERAVEDVRQGRYDLAEERLRSFLKDYPDSSLKPTAWYWLGESQFVRGQHSDAARSFLNGYNADNSGQRAPHNLYRLGVSLGRLGQKSEACATLRELDNRFPSASDGIREQAAAEADALGCG